MVRGRLLNGNPPGNPHSSPRCGAKAKSTGRPCRAPGVKKPGGQYGRCRVHGGKSRGPVTAAGLERSRKARWVDGYYSVEQKEQRRAEMAEVRSYIHTLRALIDRPPS